MLAYGALEAETFTLFAKVTEVEIFSSSMGDDTLEDVMVWATSFAEQVTVWTSPTGLRSGSSMSSSSAA